jgi:hypothetical protein
VKENGKIYLIIGSHAHVPSGSGESEFEYVYENKLRPFVANLYRYSNIQAVLHYSGVLLYWVERTHPEFFMLIEDMITRKQAELLGGGFYEPSFPLIPLQDRIGQIELMTTYIRKHFGKRPLGCWLPQMAWEQHLAAALSVSDMNYTFLSQEQFVQAGIKGAGLFSPCISEDQGKLLTIFPVSLSVEKELAEKSFSLVFVELKNKFEEVCGKCESEKIISVFPEKVSSSPEEAPDTAWNRFFEEISLSEKIVETTLPSKFLRGHKAYKKGSFPNSSAAVNNFSPRNFLIEHDESGGIYSKMIFTNVLINQLKGDKSRKLNAREELWQAQDSSLFSPGNGYLRGELRKSAYSSLLRAEMMTREKGKFIPSLIQYDFDFDGIKEFIFQDAVINCYIQPKGAGVFELDYLPKEWNYLDCGSNDFGRRSSFADVLLPFETETDKPDCLTAENSRLCFNEQYESIAQDKKGKSCFKLSACGADMPFGETEINKCYFLKRDILTVSYNLKNTGKEGQKFKFIPLICFSFANVTDEYVRFYAVDNNGKDIHLDGKFDAGNLKILDVKNEVQILITSVKPFSGCLNHVFNNGLYQATIILPVFSISLKSGESWANEFSLKFSH